MPTRMPFGRPMNLAPSCALAAGVSFCRFEDRLIFLDSVRNRYVGVLLAPDPLPNTPFAQALTERLLARGLLVAQCGPTPPIAPVEIVVPTRSLAEAPPASTMVRLAGRALLANLGARQALRRTPLREILAEVGDRRTRETCPPSSPLKPLIATFATCRRLLPLAPRCLPDSLALLRFLAGFHHHPQLIFGVAAYPFAAHCWVQTDEQILDDSHGHVAQFTPILAV